MEVTLQNALALIDLALDALNEIPNRRLGIAAENGKQLSSYDIAAALSKFKRASSDLSLEPTPPAPPTLTENEILTLRKAMQVVFTEGHDLLATKLKNLIDAQEQDAGRMKPLTKKYLADPYACPFCNSKQIQGDILHSDEIDPTLALNDIECYSCEKKWKEIYTLTAIEF
jgi:hypothetical protein